jgi:hypothetical protein
MPKAMTMNNQPTRRSALRRLAVMGALPLLAASASCDSFLDPKPEDVLSPDNFYRTSSDAVAAVNGIYEQQKWMHQLAYWYMSDVATDDIDASPNFGSDGHRLSKWTFDATEFPMGDVWGNGYKIINRSNAVLDRVPAITMDATLKARVLGEARFLRALAYFDLVRFFGDVPLLEHEVTSLEDVTPARAPAADIYALIEADLTEAAASLPASYGSSDLGRATSGAALSLLAKVHLQQKEYGPAAQRAGQVITSGRYGLVPNWKDVFAIANEFTNVESIFELNYDGTLDPGAGSVVTLFALPAGYPGGDAYGLMYLPPSAVNLFAANDERGLGGTFITSPYTDRNGTVINFTLPSQNAINKYLDEGNTRNRTQRGWGANDNNWIILRYADVLLMYAEAVNEGGTPVGGLTAEAALNLVRVRAGLDGVSGLGQGPLRTAIRQERRREFILEGQRWFDLARYGTLNETIQAKLAEIGAPVHGVPGTLFPLPQGEIDRNPNLVQNPGW